LVDLADQVVNLPYGLDDLVVEVVLLLHQALVHLAGLVEEGVGRGKQKLTGGEPVGVAAQLLYGEPHFVDHALEVVRAVKLAQHGLDVAAHGGDGAVELKFAHLVAVCKVKEFVAQLLHGVAVGAHAQHHAVIGGRHPLIDYHGFLLYDALARKAPNLGVGHVVPGDAEVEVGGAQAAGGYR
jgi:hypothetical protein